MEFFYNKFLTAHKIACSNFILWLMIICWMIIAAGCENDEVTEMDGLRVPEGFTIERVVSADLLSYPMFATFDPKGRLFVYESTGMNTMGTDSMLVNPSYHIRLLEDTDEDGHFDKSTIYADRIPFPMGGVFYNGSLYVTASPDLLKLTDTNGDGTADRRESILTGWTLNANGAILSGPFMGPDGWLYMADARRGYSIESKEGDTLKGKGARIWRCRPDGSGLEWVSAGGFDNSIELVFMPSGETIGTMTYFTDPKNGQRDALIHWVEGGVYPKYHSVIEEDELKLTGDLMPVMTKLPRVAPSGLMRYKGSFWGKEYQGNLFSAIFNTGEITRHIVKEDGATFTTKDESFISSTKSDIRPTDVLEDADGSLLVVVTGGWFIKGCPLSRVAKPDVIGGIYRIQKTEVERELDDPWGRAINFDDLSTKKLSALFSDDRPMVQKKAVDAIVQRGAASVDDLKSLLSSSDENVRTATIFALYRIRTDDALRAARSGLADTSAMVQAASARVAGLARDERSVGKLGELLRSAHLSVRRQAATALGQIGDKNAAETLLEAAADVNDRFVEHAIIHSLTLLNHSDPLVDALTDRSNKIRKAAVIALDQMDSSPLTQGQLLPFLSSKNKELRDVGIWIASHRPEWADIVIDFVKTTLGSKELTTSEEVSLRDLTVTFCGNESLQNFIGRKLNAKDTPEETKLILVDVMSRCNIQEFPSFWVDKLGNELTAGSDEVRTAILGLIETRQVENLDQQIEQIVHSSGESAEIRLKALKARVETRPKLSDREFNIVTHYFGEGNESPIRQAAVRLLSRADLNEQQLLTIVHEQLPQADLFMVPSLIEAFQGNHSEKVGLSLVKVLESSLDILDNVSQGYLQELINTYPESVQTAAVPLMEEIKKKQSKRLVKLQEMEEKLVQGDVGEGRKLFFGKATCSTCHTIGDEGTYFGPDLTNIGEIRSRHDILEAIVFPAASFAREHETYKITTTSTVYSGIITEQLQDAILLSIGPGQKIRIPRDKVTSIETQTVSLMPPGLDQQLTDEELSDLMAFLEALPYNIDRLVELEE